MKQIDDIRYIETHYGFHKLTESLAEIAEIRLEHPSASLKELGQMLDPPVGKSGVNHRLRKLSILADELRESKEE
jgi:DNA-binding protein WhiA